MVGSTTTTFPDALVVVIIFVVFVFVVVKFTQANARNIFSLIKNGKKLNRAETRITHSD
jgi:hypothetical protein